MAGSQVADIIQADPFSKPDAVALINIAGAAPGTPFFPPLWSLPAFSRIRQEESLHSAAYRIHTEDSCCSDTHFQQRCWSGEVSGCSGHCPECGAFITGCGQPAWMRRELSGEHDPGIPLPSIHIQLSCMRLSAHISIVLPYSIVQQQSAFPFVDSLISRPTTTTQVCQSSVDFTSVVAVSVSR